MPLAKLDRLLSRARQRIRSEELAEQEADRRKTDAEITQDYVLRLAERGRFRRLLSEQALDGLRFRWYFERFGGESLEATRRWIDSQMLNETPEKASA